MVKELEVLDQQTIVMYGKNQIGAWKFARDIKAQKFGEKQNKK